MQLRILKASDPTRSPPPPVLRRMPHASLRSCRLVRRASVLSARVANRSQYLSSFPHPLKT